MLRETLKEAEIGLDPEALRKVAILSFYAGGVPDFRVHIFRTDVFVGEPTETADMVTDWYQIEQLPYERMLESDREWFYRALTGEPFCADVFYSQQAIGFERIEFGAFSDE